MSEDNETVGVDNNADIGGGTLSVVASHVTNLMFGDKVDKEEGEDRITMSVFSIPESH